MENIDNEILNHLEIPIPLMHKVKRIHFVGIGGAGMCGIAEVLCNEGYVGAVRFLLATLKKTLKGPVWWSFHLPFTKAILKLKRLLKSASQW